MFYCFGEDNLWHSNSNCRSVPTFSEKTAVASLAGNYSVPKTRIEIAPAQSCMYFVPAGGRRCPECTDLNKRKAVRLLWIIPFICLFLLILWWSLGTVKSVVDALRSEPPSTTAFWFLHAMFFLAWTGFSMYLRLVAEYGFPLQKTPSPFYLVTASVVPYLFIFFLLLKVSPDWQAGVSLGIKFLLAAQLLAFLLALAVSLHGTYLMVSEKTPEPWILLPTAILSQRIAESLLRRMVLCTGAVALGCVLGLIWQLGVPFSSDLLQMGRFALIQASTPGAIPILILVIISTHNLLVSDWQSGKIDEAFRLAMLMVLFVFCPRSWTSPPAWTGFASCVLTLLVIYLICYLGCFEWLRRSGNKKKEVRWFFKRISYR
jgi:hypothetical protein